MAQAQGRKYDIIAFDAFGDVIVNTVFHTVRDARNVARRWLAYSNVASVRVLRTMNKRTELFEVYVSNNGKHCVIRDGIVKSIRVS